MSDGLTISASAAADLAAHAAAELPNEACGLLSGRAGHATRFHAARNAESSPYAYEVDPDDLVRIVLGIEADGQELVAIYHSHPRTAPIPSARDRRSAEYPVVYLISTPSEDSAIRAWRIDGGVAREVKLRIG